MHEVSIEPICRYSFDTQKVVTDYPPHLHNANKKLVYSIACPTGCTHNGRMVFSHWRSMPLPQSFSAASYPTEIEAREDLFGYEPTSEGSGIVEWYLNFADPDPFCAYGGPLLAQDEMQVAEHPALGSLREALLDSNIALWTEQEGEPTPVLIMGVERCCAIATEPNASQGRPQGLYGNNFARASAEAIERATTPIRPPTITNIIAMAAPSGGSGIYSLEQIDFILRTAFTGFSAARIESSRTLTQPPFMVVHTGFWGCGAFGGNRILMALLQLLAAHLARVDRLVFHHLIDHNAFSDALRIFKDLTSGGEQLQIAKLLTGVHAMGFQWGFSNGT